MAHAASNSPVAAVQTKMHQKWLSRPSCFEEFTLAGIDADGNAEFVESEEAQKLRELKDNWP